MLKMYIDFIQSRLSCSSCFKFYSPNKNGNNSIPQSSAKVQVASFGNW